MKNLFKILITLLLNGMLLSGCHREAPQVKTLDADRSKTTTSSAVIEGTILDAGTSPVSECGFFWGTDPDDMQKVKLGNISTNFSYTLTGLSPVTYYYYKAYALNDVNEGSGDIKQFFVKEFITNGDVEKMDQWWFNFYPVPAPVDFILESTTEESHSQSHSLKISKTHMDADSGAYWGQTITQCLPLNRKLTLSAWVKCENLAGRGVAIAIRCDGVNTQLQFVTTEGASVINGTTGWTKYSVTLNQVSQETKTIYALLLFISGTTGTVYFDDIQLIYD